MINKRIIALKHFICVRRIRPQLLYDSNISATIDVNDFIERNLNVYYTGLDPIQFFADTALQLELGNYDIAIIFKILEMLSLMHVGYEIPDLNL